MTRGACCYCGAPGVRFAQFPFGHAPCCDSCIGAHGGWREEDESAERPLCVAFPREGKREINSFADLL